MSAQAPTHARESEWALRLTQFNLHVARFAHRSWYAARSAAQVIDALCDPDGHLNTRLEPQVSDWLLRELGLRETLDWEMHEPQKRLWLLDTAALERLSQELALAMHRDWLVHLVDGARVRALRAKVNRDILRFVVQDVPQGAFHYNLPVASFDTDAPEQLTTKLTRAGACTLMALLEPAWQAVRGRAQLHFDRSWELGDVPPFESEHCSRALELICGRLIPRRFPEWAWLF